MLKSDYLARLSSIGAPQISQCYTGPFLLNSTSVGTGSLEPHPVQRNSHLHTFLAPVVHTE